MEKPLNIMLVPIFTIFFLILICGTLIIGGNFIKCVNIEKYQRSTNQLIRQLDSYRRNLVNGNKLYNLYEFTRKIMIYVQRETVNK